MKRLVNVKAGQIVSLGEFRDPATGELSCDYYGQYLYKKINGNLVLGICAPKLYVPAYRLDDMVEVSYIDSERKQKYKVITQVADLRAAGPDEDFDVGHNMAGQQKEDVDKYIVELVVVGRPEKSTQRAFFRLPLHLEIYCKVTGLQEAGALTDLADSHLRMDAALAQAFKQEADDGLLEEEAGYFKIITEDISAGGFMFRSSYRFEEETYLECMIAVDRTVLPAAARVVKTKDELGEGSLLDRFLIHVQFYKMSDPVRDRLIRHMIAIQRQMRKTRKPESEEDE